MRSASESCATMRHRSAVESCELLLEGRPKPVTGRASLKSHGGPPPWAAQLWRFLGDRSLDSCFLVVARGGRTGRMQLLSVGKERDRDKLSDGGQSGPPPPIRTESVRFAICKCAPRAPRRAPNR